MLGIYIIINNFLKSLFFDENNTTYTFKNCEIVIKNQMFKIIKIVFIISFI